MVGTTRTLADIEPLTKKTIERFMTEVLVRQQSNVVKIVLFGSAARGDENKDSDIDVFLLLENDNVDRDLIRSAVIADDMNNYETYTTPFSMSLKEYADSERIEPVIKNIKKEGIVLYDSQR